MIRPIPVSFVFVGTGIAIAIAAMTTATGCAPRARMCTASSECTNKATCVAGRCQPERVSVKPAIDNARRLVVRPVDIAYVRAGDAPNEGLPPVFALGRDPSMLLLRFAVALPQTANVIEAYVVLHRATGVDDDPAPISLHATRIVEAWNGRSTSWAMQPRSSDVRLPSTVVEPGGPAIIRLDVRELVRQWARRDGTDQGVGIVAENETRTGTTFALSSMGVDWGSDLGSDSWARALPGRAPATPSLGAAPDIEPYLELYVR